MAHRVWRRSHVSYQHLQSEQEWEDYNHPDKSAEENGDLVVAGTAYLRVPGATSEAKTSESSWSKGKLCRARILLEVSEMEVDVRLSLVVRSSLKSAAWARKQ